jgi:hypothetical protein
VYGSEGQLVSVVSVVRGGWPLTVRDCAS